MPSTSYKRCKKYYMCSFEKEWERYCGLTIKWGYVGKKVQLSMPSYVEKALKCFQHPPPIVPQDQLHQHLKKLYVEKIQLANPLDTSPPLNKAGKKFIQEVTGVFLYLVQAVDLTMVCSKPLGQPQVDKQGKELAGLRLTSISCC